MHLTIPLGVTLHGNAFMFLYAVSRRRSWLRQIGMILATCSLSPRTMAISARPRASHSRTTPFRARVRSTPERRASSWPTARWLGASSFSRSATCHLHALELDHPRCWPWAGKMACASRTHSRSPGWPKGHATRGPALSMSASASPVRACTATTPFAARRVCVFAPERMARTMAPLNRIGRSFEVMAESSSTRRVYEY